MSNLRTSLSLDTMSREELINGWIRSHTLAHQFLDDVVLAETEIARVVKQNILLKHELAVLKAEQDLKDAIIARDLQAEEHRRLAAIDHVD
jgi:hypothetical protein